MSARQPIATMTFAQLGDFSAARAAEAALTAAGFSVGRTEAHFPRGILFGSFNIQKWRNLNGPERAALDGIMTGGRSGPVVISLYESALARCPDAVALIREHATQAEQVSA